MEYQDLIKKDKYRELWNTLFVNELGMLAQGIHDVKGTNTIFFIKNIYITKDRQKDVTYGRILVLYRTQKLDPNISSLTMGGDLIVCLYDVSTPTSDLPMIKMLWNSVLSSPGA